MYARTERRLGIAAALALTFAAFVMPGSMNHLAPRDAAMRVPTIEKTEPVDLAVFSNAAASAVHYD
ncbi:hypothetical protein ACFO1V_14420 [Daeguia caeni]|uniref:Uncharacterized protein n=1 Tax=Daeguia caeni TaxID=439612 RepID=A0ABV9H7P8_9HYPH